MSVWDAEEELRERPITLLYEHRVPLMRLMGFTMHLVAFQGKVETQWTKRMASKSGNKNINNEFSRAFRSYSSFGGFEEDPWVPASKEIMDLIKTNIPKKSDASFFEKGWQDENRFVKWLQEVVGRHRIHKVILVDPYFDAEAVSKFLALANYNDLAYEVITDIAIEEGKGNKITEACVRLKAILPSRVNIHGLSRVNEGSGQIFHDRFLILYGQDEGPVVYMLSNSISGVAKKFPSVVLPVPRDVGDELVEYYSQLISGEGKYEVPEVKTVTLWSTEMANEDTRQDDQTEEGTGFPGFQYLKTILFEEGDVPKEQLGSENRLLFAEDDKEKTRQFEKLGEAISRLQIEEPQKAIELWCGIANWSAHLLYRDKKEMWDWFHSSKYRSDFIAVAEVCLHEGAELDYPLGVKDMGCSAESISIGKQSILPFEKMSRISNSLLEHRYRGDYPVNHSVKMAFRYLMQYAPEIAYKRLGLIIDFVEKMDDRRSTEEMQPYYKLISMALQDVAMSLSGGNIGADFSKLEIGLKSSVAIIRAMHVSALSQYLNSGDWLDKDIDILELVKNLDFLEDSLERIYACSWIAFDCQVLRNKMEDNQVGLGLMDCLKDKIVHEWSFELGDKKILRPILVNLSGPIEGSHANDIFELLELLVQEGKVSKQEAMNYIQEVLLEKINNHRDGEKSIYTKADIPFTYGSISCFVNLAPEKTDGLLKAIMKIGKVAKRKLLNPFARAKSFMEWKRSIEVLSWCGICIAQMSVQPKLEKGELIEELERIHQTILPYVEDFHDGYGLVQMFNTEYNLALKGESL